MRENRTSGTVRGATGNESSYREMFITKNMRKFDYILFDFFGTLAEYKTSIFDSPYPKTMEHLQEQGLDFSEFEFMELFKSCFDHLEIEASKTYQEYSMDDVVIQLYEKTGRTNVPQKLISALVYTYMSDWINGVQLYDGVQDLLRNMKSKKAIITNTHYAPLVPTIVSQNKIAHHFDLIETSVENGFRKPSSTIFVNTINKLGCHINDVLFVGDNPDCDYFGPRNVGMESVVISNSIIEGIPREHQISDILMLNEYLGS